ncbi:AbiU2 domain-containing protein [Trinickia symbiotica]|uniref:AbiU2 domain-containing protein n=1 Tax=Trinickia symbiotica TaxID=863227 RepID=UPI0003A4C2E6|nr:hypothetical protein [Trinickia symbiotica]
MNVNDLPVLKDRVHAAQEELDMAVLFHTSWKPAAYDEDLRERMGNSYATHTFNIVRMALRREMLMALMRIWDYTDDSVRIGSVIDGIRSRDVIDALVAERLSGLSKQSNMTFLGFGAQMRDAIQSGASKAIELFEQYCPGGSRRAVLENLRRVRHERLAHRQVTPSKPNGPAATDEQIEAFYQDTTALVGKLLSVVLGVAYNFAETANVYSRPAALFWMSVRGERTEGHPDYRPGE